MNDLDGNPLGHPELEAAFEVLETIIKESDRGAVLVAASVADSYLSKLFLASAAASDADGTVKHLLRYPGPLSTFAAKSDIALVSGMIDSNVHGALQTLRRIRNDVAHSPADFALRDHLPRVRSMYELGPGVPQFINEFAGKILIQTMVRHLLESEQAKPDNERSFRTPEDVLDALIDNEPAKTILQEKAYRAELGLATAIICALLLVHRDRPSQRRSMAFVGEQDQGEVADSGEA